MPSRLWSWRNHPFSHVGRNEQTEIPLIWPVHQMLWKFCWFQKLFRITSSVYGGLSAACRTAARKMCLTATYYLYLHCFRSAYIAKTSSCRPFCKRSFRPFTGAPLINACMNGVEWKSNYAALGRRRTCRVRMCVGLFASIIRVHGFGGTLRMHLAYASIPSAHRIPNFHCVYWLRYPLLVPSGLLLVFGCVRQIKHRLPAIVAHLCA